jgi:hypothetical protein
MALTQNGSSVTGNILPTTVNLSGLTSTVSGTITGSVSGTAVSLTAQMTVAVRAGTDTLNCRGTDTFALQTSGNTMTGTFTPNATPYICDGGIPLPISFPSGPIVLTRQ